MKLEVKNLFKRFDNKEVLSDISLLLSKGDNLYIKGSNGSGKSTLMNIIAGFDKDYEGKISREDIKKEDIGYVMQDIILVEDISVRDNITLFTNKAKINKNLYKALYQILNIDDIYEKKVSTLSGGQKRRVNFIVGMMNSPRLILLDEPFVGIDDRIKKNIIEFLIKYKKDKILIMTSHEEENLEKIINKYIHLENGKITDGGKYE